MTTVSTLQASGCPRLRSSIDFLSLESDQDYEYKEVDSMINYLEESDIIKQVNISNYCYSLTPKGISEFNKMAEFMKTHIHLLSDETKRVLSSITSISFGIKYSNQLNASAFSFASDFEDSISSTSTTFSAKQIKSVYSNYLKTNLTEGTLMDDLLDRFSSTTMPHGKQSFDLSKMKEYCRNGSPSYFDDKGEVKRKGFRGVSSKNSTVKTYNKESKKRKLISLWKDAVKDLQ